MLLMPKIVDAQRADGTQRMIGGQKDHQFLAPGKLAAQVVMKRY
jgi:hypothetical protein